MNNNLKISVQTSPWYNTITNNDTVDKAISFIKDCGFEALDYNIDSYLPWNAISSGNFTEFFSKSIEELCDFHRPLKEACEKYGVSVAMMHAPFPTYVLDKDNINDYLIMSVEKCCAVSQYLGCTSLVVHPYTNKDLEIQHKINIDMYTKMIPAAKKYDITICLENMWSRNEAKENIDAACSTVEETCFYIDKLNEIAGEKIFGYCLDIGHANMLKRDIYDFITKLGDRLTTLHMHDNNEKDDQHFAPYINMGFSKTTNWNEVLRGLKDTGYQGPLNFETGSALAGVPTELWHEALGFISETGKYFRNRLNND